MTGPCVGGIGHVLFDETTQNVDTSSGSGGGGHATDGGNGGNGNGVTGGAKGTSSGTSTLVPLRGGCASGGADDNSVPFKAIGARGGGALQISSRVAIKIAGTIDAQGEPGFSLQTFVSGLSLGWCTARSASRRRCGNGESPREGWRRLRMRGSRHLPTGQVSNGAPGLAATATRAATNGQSSTAQFGGGGGLGRIRINTRDATFSTTSASAVEGDVTTAVLETR